MARTNLAALALLCASSFAMITGCESAEVVDCDDMPEHPDCAPPPCTPGMDEMCEPGESCVLQLGTVASAVCARVGTRARGAFCARSGECAAGLTCAENRFGVVSCLAVCTPVGETCSGDRGGMCTSFDPMVEIDSVEYGFCAVD